MVALVKNIRLLFLMVILINSANAEISIVNFEQTSSSVAGRKVSGLSVAQKPGNYCWSSAEATYGVPAKLLVAIAKVETGINPSLVGKNIQRLGYNWDAVGAYNAKTNWKRDIYAKKVHKAILELGYNR